MNGRFRVEYFSFWSGEDWRRLGAALAASCVLHAGLVLVPAGEGTPEAGPSLPVLDVRVLTPAAPQTSEPSSARPPSKPEGEATGKPAPAVQAVVAGPRIPVMHFYTADQLMVRPRPMTHPVFDVQELTSVVANGTVILGIYIDSLGNVVSVEIEKTDLPKRVAATAARAFATLQYSPGMIPGGHRVASLMRVEVTYFDGKREVRLMGAPR